VRSAYSDPLYTELTREAIRWWKENSCTGGTYHDLTRLSRMLLHALTRTECRYVKFG
jgi:hypothetical protein